ncbi:hypothetical protein C8Q80DRAFT_177021 [Daedaleopsis nitida]|nr:hypothetical protein C8Q80DRAFT_177021 [Daedaleopsis nitida]
MRSPSPRVPISVPRGRPSKATARFHHMCHCPARRALRHCNFTCDTRSARLQMARHGDSPRIDDDTDPHSSTFNVNVRRSKERKPSTHQTMHVGTRQIHKLTQPFNRSPRQLTERTVYEYTHERRRQNVRRGRNQGLLPHIPILVRDLPQRHYLQGNREDLLIQLDEWADSRGPWGSQPVFLLTGGPYTGKSTVAAEFCRRRRSRESLGAAFLCVEGWDSHNEVAWSLDSLAATMLAVQLARSKLGFYLPVLQAARHASKRKLSDVRWAFEELIQRPLETLTADHPPICIVIDVVDGGNADSATCHSVASTLDYLASAIGY